MDAQILAIIVIIVGWVKFLILPNKIKSINNLYKRLLNYDKRPKHPQKQPVTGDYNKTAFQKRLQKG